MVYIVVTLILVFGAVFFDRQTSAKGSKIWYIVEWIAIVLLAGLRYRVGGDTLSYHDDFQTFPTLSQLTSEDFTKKYNFLWVIFESWCKTTVDDFAFLQIVHAIIFNSILFWFVKKHSSRPFSVILYFSLLFFFRYNTETIRASLSVAMFLLSYDYLINKKYIYYFCFCALAYGFHNEGLIMFIFPIVHLLKKIKISIASVTAIILVSIGAMFIDFLPLMSNILSSSERVSENFRFYAENATYGSGVSLLGYMKVFVLGFLWIFLLWVLKGNHYRELRTFVVLFYFTSFQVLNYSNIFYRIQDFLNPLMMIAVGECIVIFKKDSAFLKKVSFYLLFSSLFIDKILSYSNGSWVLFFPYYSIFDPQISSLREVYYYELWMQ